MIAGAKWWMRVPKERSANLRFRRFVLARAAMDLSLRKALIEACRQDFLFWVNVFVWQYNPRKKAVEVGPFISWDFQERAASTMLECIGKDQDLLIEKSREMGATWLCLLVMMWLFLFHPWKKFLLISRNEKAVEDEDPDSLFWKIDFVLRYMPAWLLPAIKRRKLYYGNESNGSTITGQASTGSAGVGGRATAMFIDEFSQIKEDFEVLHRTSDTTGCRIFNGTHLGLDTAFYELSRRVDLRKLQMHWTEHPDKIAGLYRYDPLKNKVEVLDKAHAYPEDFSFVLTAAPTGGPCPGLRSPWYDDQCKRKGSPRAVAMDLDIDPAGASHQFVSPLLIRDLIATYCIAPYWVGDLAYDRDTAVPNEDGPLQANPGGRLKLWLRPDARGKPPTGSYAGGCDLAEGTGATCSCFSLINTATGEKVLEYADPFIRPEQFAVLVVSLCRLFKDEAGEGSKLAWERQGPGERFGKVVLEMGYRHIHYQQNEKAGPWAKSQTDVPGWYPSPENKTLLLGEYRAALTMRQMLNRSESALKEFLSFQYGPRGFVEFGGQGSVDDLSGAGVNHGDQVIADALAWKMAKGGQQRAKREAVEAVPPMSLAWRRELATASEGKEAAW